jgi:cytidylate kinase
MKLREILKRIILTEGVDDPGILKCVFMAGGPGSGKSFTSEEIFGIDRKYKASFAQSGLKVINSDTAFESQLKKNGINPKDLGRIEREEPELWATITAVPGGIRDRAKKITQAQRAFYEEGRLGMMVFVNTSLEVAKERNAGRDRTLPENLVTSIWKDCQENMGKFQTLFGAKDYRIIDNTTYGPPPNAVQKAVNEFIRRPIYNPIGKKWIETARMLKKAGQIK